MITDCTYLNVETISVRVLLNFKAMEISYATVA